MKMNHRDKKYAIYIGERLEREPGNRDDSWYHTFLMLIDETREPVTILQQLHYNDDVFGNLLPNVREGVSGPEKFESVMALPIIGGASEHVLHLWNAALSYAFYLKHMGIRFGENYKHGETDVNCRAAVISTLESIGIAARNVHYAEAAGTQCGDIPLSHSFDHSASNVPDIDVISTTNQNYLVSLGADWISEKRYVGPIRRPFIALHR